MVYTILMQIYEAALLLVTGIGIFFVGVTKFSQMLQGSGNQRIKSVFDKMGNNRFANFGVGAGATVLIQSSTATTVIIVGLVNAGIMNLTQSTAAIFGANFGTALSNFMLVLSTFSVKYFFMALVFVGSAIKLFSKSKKLNVICDIFISLGIIFVGLYLMGGAFSNSQQFTDAFQSLFRKVNFPLLLILLGFALTVLMQSSIAASALFITLANSGVVNGQAVLSVASVIYLIIGSKLGHTLTTLLSSIKSSKNAKRTALVHLFFNVFGVVLFLSLVWPLESHIVKLFEGIDTPWIVTIFGLVFAGTTSIILLFFIKPLNRLVSAIIKDKPIEVVPVAQNAYDDDEEEVKKSQEEEELEDEVFVLSESIRKEIIPKENKRHKKTKIKKEKKAKPPKVKKIKEKPNK